MLNKEPKAKYFWFSFNRRTFVKRIWLGITNHIHFLKKWINSIQKSMLYDYQKETNDDDEKLERGLPIYLQKDIDAWIAGQADPNCTHMDCLWGELYGSINSAYHGNEITKEQSDYLFKKYLDL